MGKIYRADGFINWEYLYNECKFIMSITGSRGTGKTYGLLDFILEHGLKFIYLRRLKSQLDNCVSNEANNPFKAINSDTGSEVIAVRTRGAVEFQRPAEDESGEMVTIGYGAALSTVATIRGSDFSDVDVIVFDEFIAMTNERPIKNEVFAFMNFLETVNRNRELLGRAPVKCFMLGNANRLMNPYFLEWHFMRTALKMIRGGQMVWRNKDNTRIMILLLNSPISERKRETALYQDASADFLSLAIDNAFATDATYTGTRKLTDCRHIVSFGSIGVYQLKSTGEHYISETINKSNYYEENEINLLLFRNRFSLLKTIYIYGSMLFENYDVELLFRAYMDIQ